MPHPLSSDPPESPPPDWLEILEHTADIGIRIHAHNLPTLFSRAAWGMFTLITDPQAVQPLRPRSLTLNTEDLPDLLVRWLSELNFLHNTRRELYSRFEVTLADDTHLRAVVIGEKIDPSRHTVHTEIKAVTFHELRVEKHGELWTAQVIFDL